MTKSRRITLAFGAFVAAASCTAVLASAQSDTGSLSAVVNEIRLLRLSVEKSSQTQAQIQALAVSLSAQQSRLVQMSARTDDLRKQLDSIVEEHSATRAKVAELERDAPRLTEETLRIEVKRQLDSLRALEQRLSTREASVRNSLLEAESTLQTEINRWNDLMGRLDQATR